MPFSMLIYSFQMILMLFRQSFTVLAQFANTVIPCGQIQKFVIIDSNKMTMFLIAASTLFKFICLNYLL